MYQERMFNYYPQVIQIITEFQAIIDSEYPEFDDLAVTRDKIINDAYLLTMGKERIIQWEKILDITPSKMDSLDTRRATIMARIRGQGKLNTDTINNIVNAFTNGTAESWVENNTLHINIIPNNESFKYDFETMIKEINRKSPIHMGTTQYILKQDDCGSDTTLYVACAVTYGEHNVVNIIGREVTSLDINTLAAIVITHGEDYYIEVIE